MKRSFFSILTVACTLAAGIGLASAADDAEARAHFERQAREINNLTKKSPQALQTALKTVSVETGVPLEQIRAEHRRYPTFGTAGILLANVLAAETKKDPETFLKQRQAGKDWLALAAEHKVPIEKLNVRLDNLLRALAPFREKQTPK